MNHISCVDTSRAYQLAFSAEHTFGNFFSKVLCFAPLDQEVYFSRIKIGQLCSRAGGGATSATIAPFKRGFILGNKPGNRKIILFEINLPPF